MTFPGGEYDCCLCLCNSWFGVSRLQAYTQKKLRRFFTLIDTYREANMATRWQ